MKKIFSILIKLLLLGIVVSLPYFIYRYFFTPQKIGINEISSSSAIIDPQYIFVRKNNTFDGPFLWNGDNPDRYNDAAIAEIVNTVGTKGTSNRRLGVGALFEPNLTNLERTKQSLAKLLQISLSNDFPVYLSLDNFNWWEGRPDLWNWWDPSKPGYNPNNRNNVEWLGWDGATNDENVMKLSWTNWGQQFRRPPGPNLLSPAYINNSINNLNQLLPIVTNWYKALPADKKYLLGGIDFGNELDIGGNYYYLENGNSYINQPTSNDPVYPNDFLAHSKQTGYAALKSGNIKSSGTITTQDLNLAVNRYLNTLNKHAYEAGIPRNKIFNHTGGKGSSPDWIYPNSIVFSNLNSSIMSSAQPGWSFYGDITTNPQNSSLLTEALNSIGNTEWASPEWMTGASDKNGWIAALRNTLNHRNNRLLNVANWEDIKGNSDAIQAIQTVVNEAPSCWVTSPQLNIAVNGNAVTFNWIKGTSNDTLSLNVSNIDGFALGGILQTPNIIVENGIVGNSYTKTGLDIGKYYVILAADGCSNQRRIVYSSFEIKPPSSNPSDYNGKPVKGTTDTTSVYFMEAGKKRGIPDWDTYIYGLGFKAGDEVTLPDSFINSIPLGSPVPPVSPSVFNGKPVKGTTDKNTIYLVENGIRRSYPNEALFLASFTHAQVIQLSDATLARIPRGNNVGDNTTTIKPGDLNGDGKVDIFDYNLLISKYGNPYTIFDFNNIIANFGK